MNGQNRDNSHRVIHREYKDPQGNIHTEYEDVKGDLHTEYTDPQGNVHPEYRDAQGNIHSGYKDAQGNIHSGYRDAQGNIHTEYRDAQGNIHTEYRDAQENIRTEHTDTQRNIPSVEEYRQDMRESRADKNLSRGILTGVIVTCVAGLMAWTIYLFNQMNNPHPVSIINLPTLESNPKPEPSPEPVKIVEQPTGTTVPKAQTQTPESTQKTTAEPSASNQSPKQGTINGAKPSTNAGAIDPKPIAVPPSNGSVTNSNKPSTNTGAIAPKPIAVPPSNGSVTNSNVTKTDGDLQKEILTQFDNNLPNNQLIVEVTKGEVTVSGTVATPEQLEQIKPLLKSVQGIGKVDVTATVLSEK